MIEVSRHADWCRHRLAGAGSAVDTARALDLDLVLVTQVQTNGKHHAVHKISTLRLISYLEVIT